MNNFIYELSKNNARQWGFHGFTHVIHFLGDYLKSNTFLKNYFHYDFEINRLKFNEYGGVDMSGYSYSFACN